MLHPKPHLDEHGPASTSAATGGELDSQPPHPSHTQLKPSCVHFLHSAVEHSAHSHRGSGSPHMKHMALPNRKPFDSFHTKRAALSLLQSCAACRVISLGSVTGLVLAIPRNSSKRSIGARPKFLSWSQHSGSMWDVGGLCRPGQQDNHQVLNQNWQRGPDSEPATEPESESELPFGHVHNESRQQQ